MSQRKNKIVVAMSGGVDCVRHTVGKRYPGDDREMAFGTEFNVAKVNGAKS
jgi:predicted PP-loop superfamily ATPase